MKTILIVGGPLILVVAAVVILVHSGVLFFGTVDGVEHQAGVEVGGSFALEDRNESFSEASGLSMELEEQPIEYRDGVESTHVRKLDGLKKFGFITLKWPIHMDDLDIPFFNWIIKGVDERVQRDIETEVETEIKIEGGVEMKQIDPPVLVIPAR